MGARVAETTAADYAWLKDDWAFCFSLVRGLDEVEVLRRFGGERAQPRTLTLAEAGQLSGSFHAGYPQLILVAKAGSWSVAVEDNGWEGTRPEVLRALSRGTQAVSVHSTVGALGHFNYAVDGEVLVSFELLFPHRRLGSQPDLLLPQMRAVGLDADRHEPSYDDAVIAVLALAERITGVHLDLGVLAGPLLAPRSHRCWTTHQRPSSYEERTRSWPPPLTTPRRACCGGRRPRRRVTRSSLRDWNTTR